MLEATNTCACGELISNYKYTYDNGGLITKEVAKENLFTSDKDYGHTGGASDKCMHKADNPWQNQNPVWETTNRIFIYDDNGQMTRCEESKGQFDKTTYTYTYDANGNLTHECFRKQAEVVYQYDTENRLTAVYDQQKLLVASTYDGDGNRAFQLNYNPEATCGYGMNVSGEIFMPEHSQNEDESLTAEGQLFSYICSKTGRAYDLTEYVNDINRQYVETLTAYTINSGATESYSYAGEQRLSRNNIWDEAQGVRCNQTSYYLYDGRGSVTANTWYNGMVTDVYQYDPYGQVELGGTKHTDFYGYNAESYNPNSGLEFLRARYYNANQGRFFQEDTYLGDIIDPLTLNRYAYVKNSPMNYVDPSGHWSNNMYAPNYQAGSPNNATSPYTEPFSGGNWNNTATNVGSQLKNGEISLSKSGDALQVSLKVAEEHGEDDWCAVGKEAASLILGMYVQKNTYSDNAIEWLYNKFGLGKYASALIGMAENSLVERFLNPEMYYTGKYLVDAYIYAKTYSAGKIMQTLNNIFSGEETGFAQTASLGLTSYLLYGATETTTTGTLITVGGETIAGAATVSVTATGVVVVLGGALILTIQASANGASQESMQENKDKADSYKGDSEAGHMLGENGTQVSGSKTTGQNGKIERVDVENPAPGKRPGDVHYHEPNNTKWRYDMDSGKLVDPSTGELAPPKVQKVLESSWFQKAIDILGE